jgi:hypothetical protein
VLLAMLCALASMPSRAAAGYVGNLRAMCGTPPDYEVVRAESYSAAQQQDALAGRFEVFDQTLTLKPPVNWRLSSGGSRTFQSELHNLQFLDPLLFIYRTSSDQATRVQALGQARDLALDWIARNPRSGPAAATVSHYAWENPKVVGDRSGYLAYLTRAAACEPDLLDDSQASTFVASLRRHLFHLRDGARPANDFPLYMDFGLAMIADQLPFMAESAEAAALAERRFAAGIAKRLTPEGVWLEHSTAYHFFTERLLQSFIQFTGTSRAGLTGADASMREVAPWFVQPDGFFTQWGDSDLRRAPSFARAATPPGFPGLAPTARSGFGIVKTSDSYVGIAAGYFSPDHKQADDGTFDFSAGGHRIVSDTGKYDYVDGGRRSFAVSTPAHSVLTVDGKGFGGGPYGSGIWGTGAATDGSGWYAIGARNPRLRRQHASHLRLLLYRPGEALIVVDRALSRRVHTYRRYVQLGPDITPQRIGSSRSFNLDAANPALSATLYDARPRPRGQKTRAFVIRGQWSADPAKRLGFTFPAGRQVVPRSTIVQSSTAKRVVFVSTLSLDRTHPVYAQATGTRGPFRLQLARPGEPNALLAVSGNGIGGLSVTETPVP